MTTETPTLSGIDSLAAEYEKLRKILAERVASLETELAELQRRRLPGIKSAAALCKLAQDELRAAVEAAPELFIKPRTFTLHGIKVGFAKGKGKIVIEDLARTVALIRKHLPDQAEVLIVVTEAIAKKAVANLPAGDLKRVGILIEETGDQSVVTAADTHVDKLVSKLLNEGAQAVEEES